MEILGYIHQVNEAWVKLQTEEANEFNLYIAESRRNNPETIAVSRDFLAMSGAEEEVLLRSMLISLAFRELSARNVLPIMSRYQSFTGGYKEHRTGVLSIIEITKGLVLSRTNSRRGLLFTSLPDANDSQYQASRLLVTTEANKYLTQIGRPSLPSIS
jgi:hypothetical protein